MKQEDKIVKLDNTRSITQENYEVLAKKYKASMKHVADMIYYMRKRFDEAFTKYPNSNPNERKLKDFEIHESRNYKCVYCLEKLLCKSFSLL